MKKIIYSLALTIILAACSDNSQNEMLVKAAAIESSDECHLCGMLIKEFPGPKGEANRKEMPTQIKKFCSTRDLFTYYLDPENKRNVQQLFVHDMSKSPWQSPNDEHFIDGTKAWYVLGSEKSGAMGSTLGSFSAKTDAQAFAKEFGGSVKAFKEITLSDLL